MTKEMALAKCNIPVLKCTMENGRTTKEMVKVH